MTNLTTKLNELLKEVEEEMDDLSLYAMELNFTNHLQGLDDKVNKLAFRKLQIESWLIKSLLRHDADKAEKWFKLFCDTLQAIVELFKIEKLKVVDMEGEIVTDGDSIFLNRTMNQTCKYKIYIEYIKLL